MVGRKRKPTKLHLVQGTARKCRLNKREPKAPKEPPRSAVELQPKASFWYGILVGRLQSLGIASIAHSEKLMLCAMVLAEVEVCDNDIAKNGSRFLLREPKTYRGQVIYDKEGKPVQSVRIVQNPAVNQRAKATARAQSLLSDFGLSPADMGKVSVIQPNEQASNPWEELAN